MTVVVLLRGANLGSKRFSPKAVEKELADLGVVSIGAAGSFVVHGRVAEGKLRSRFAAALPFEADTFLVEGRVLLAAVAAGAKLDVPEGAKRFATVMSEPPARPKLPLEAPAGAAWGVRVIAMSGPFALGVRRRVDETGVYPNEVIEKALGVRATTRDWPTMEKLARLL